MFCCAVCTLVRPLARPFARHCVMRPIRSPFRVFAHSSVRWCVRLLSSCRVCIWRCLFCIRIKDLVILGYHGNFLILELGGLAPPRTPLRALYERRGNMKHEWRGTSNHTCSDRPLPTCNTSIVVTATIFTPFKPNTKETTKEVARPKAASPLLWWRPQAANFVHWL